MKINGKKVSLTHYLNKELESYFSEGSRYYQLYTTINYNTKTTRFKAFRLLEMKKTDRVWINERHEEAIQAQQIEAIAPDIYDADKMVMRIIEHEIHQLGEKFTLKGFGKRLDLYGKRIEEVYPEFDHSALGIMPEAQHIAKDGISVMKWVYSPTVYDWIFEDGKKKFASQIQSIESDLKNKLLENIELAISKAIKI